MIDFTPYSERTIQFVKVDTHENWRIKVYTITRQNSSIDALTWVQIKSHLTGWLEKCHAYKLPVYQIATMIVHAGVDACYVLINWWTGENMLQNYVYIKKDQDADFSLYSGDGMTACVWELAVIWHERNAWIKHILMQPEHPQFEQYLLDTHISVE